MKTRHAHRPIFARSSRGCVPKLRIALLLAIMFTPLARSQTTDFGDAPDEPGYATTVGRNGARHTILHGFYMGVRVDAEPDGQPSSGADADDLKETYNDEDGVVFLAQLTPGATGAVMVIASAPGSVSGWIDFERNKSWAEAGNRVFTTSVSAGTNKVSFLVPAGAIPGSTYARFRFSKQGTVNYYGPAEDGEVEDYRVIIRAVDFGDCPDAVRRPRSSRLAAADGEVTELTGHVVAIDGDWLVAAGPGGGEGYYHAGIGVAYVFRWNGLKWVEFEKIMPSSNPEDDGRNISMALSGEWMMIGTPAHDPVKVHVYHWTGIQWVRTQTLTRDSPGASASGGTVAIDGTRAVVRGPSGMNVLELDGTVWVTQAVLSPPDGSGDFGVSVAIEGDDILVGATSYYPERTMPGAVYHFSRTGEGVWVEKYTWSAPDAEAGDLFGDAVGLASGRAVVGLPGTVFNAAGGPGAVYVYSLGSGGWSLIETQRYYSYEHAEYGRSVALTEDHMAAGAPSAFASNGSVGRGEARLFVWDGAGWRDSARYSVTGGIRADQFGKSVALSDRWLAVGAPYAPEGSGVGEVYTYDLTPSRYAYPTLYVNDGARHVINPAVYLGEKIDAEPNAYASFDASGDDAHDGGDEDGIGFITTLFPGLEATVAAFPSVNGYLSGWIDFNDDGDWDDAYETILSAHSVTAGVSYATFLVAPDAAAQEQGNPLYARFRFSTQPVLTAGGEAPDGEVEDYSVKVDPFPDQMDFGDAPDSGGCAYHTLLANRGAWHAIDANGPWMGGKPDPEANGAPTLDADGDDADVMDEDGVAFNTTLVRGRTAALQVSCAASPSAGYLNAWIDYNCDGDWDNADEHIVTDAPVAAGAAYSWSATVPETAMLGYTYARFRICSAAGLPAYGPAVDGEVEDYVVKIFQEEPTTDIVITNIEHGAALRSSDVMWTSEPGVLYQLQSTTNLAPLPGSGWSNVGALVLGPLSRQQDTNAPQPQGFYRVVAPWVEAP